MQYLQPSIGVLNANRSKSTKYIHQFSFELGFPKISALGLRSR
jgi:hypothetical protein